MSAEYASDAVGAAPALRPAARDVPGLQAPVAAAAAPTAVVRPSRVLALDGTSARDATRDVAVELPVEVAFAGTTFAVMMLTPADLIDFAYGFCLTEGIIEAAADIRDVALEPATDGLRLAIALKGERLHKHLARQRAMTGRTGCGVCGIDDIGALQRAGGRVRAEHSPLDLPAIDRALASLDGLQLLNSQTRSVHGAAWADPDGRIRLVREDVGRHNALDKLIGALLRDGVDPTAGFVLITSRCSFEMVEKTAVFGATTLVAISAPTSLAIARAEALGIRLCAIARRDTLTLFTPLP